MTKDDRDQRTENTTTILYYVIEVSRGGGSLTTPVWNIYIYNPPIRFLQETHAYRRAYPRLICSMFDQAVPAIWQSKSYPSLKPLGPWYQDLIDRLGFMSAWVNDGIPPVRIMIHYN